MLQNPLQRHLNNNTAKIARLLRSNRKDVDAISIILAEMYFRPPAILLLEYVFYKLCLLFSPVRARHVSLGMAQIQARHWHNQINLQTITSIDCAYDELMHMWKFNDVVNLPLRKKIAFHVGETRTFYLSVVNECKTYAESRIFVRLGNRVTS